MLLYELDLTEPLLVKLVAITSQLQSEIAQGNQKEDWTVGEFLSYLKAEGIIIDRSDLYDMIKTPPLSNRIDNIKDNKIIFKGSKDKSIDSAGVTKDNNQKIVKQMAKDALK